MTNKESFREFFNSDANPDKQLPPKLRSFAVGSAAISNSLIGSILATGLPFPDNSREEFAEKVSSLSHSDEFISDLSEDIGQPVDGESEEEFVARAKRTMADLLRKRLN
jgi:hypothetical protein